MAKSEKKLENKLSILAAEMNSWFKPKYEGGWQSEKYKSISKISAVGMPVYSVIKLSKYL